MIKFIPSLLYCWLLTTAAAFAHLPFETTTTARLQHRRLELVVTVSNDTAAALLPDANQSTLTEAAFAGLRPQFLKQEMFKVLAGGVPLPVERADVIMKAGGEVEFVAFHPEPIKGPLRFEATFLSRLPHGFFSQITVFDAAETKLGRKILMSRDNVLEIPFPPPEVVAVAPTPTPIEPTKAPLPACNFLKLGVVQSLSHYKHLIILCGLLIVCQSPGSLLRVAVAFALVHAITLSSLVHFAALPNHIAEVLVAASGLFIGIANLISGNGEKGRALFAVVLGVTLSFGSSLRESLLNPTAASQATALLSFNLGAGIVHLALAAILAAALWQLRKSPALTRGCIRAFSAALVLLGSYWLLQQLRP